MKPMFFISLFNNIAYKAEGLLCGAEFNINRKHIIYMTNLRKIENPTSKFNKVSLSQIAMLDLWKFNSLQRTTQFTKEYIGIEWKNLLSAELSDHN